MLKDSEKEILNFIKGSYKTPQILSKSIKLCKKNEQNMDKRSLKNTKMAEKKHQVSSKGCKKPSQILSKDDLKQAKFIKKYFFKIGILSKNVRGKNKNNK